MKKASIQLEILQYLGFLEKNAQQKVLSYLKSLMKKPDGKNDSKDILKYAGTFSKQDISEMNKAIEEGCEKINPDEW